MICISCISIGNIKHTCLASPLIICINDFLVYMSCVIKDAELPIDLSEQGFYFRVSVWYLKLFRAVALALLLSNCCILDGTSEERRR